MTEFSVLLGPDYAGKTTVLRALSARGWNVVTSDDERFPVLGALRLLWLGEVLPELGGRYSRSMAMAVLNPLIVHLRDQVELMAERGGPVVVDSYYYKLLAKLRMADLLTLDIQASWLELPHPARVVFLDADPEFTWERTHDGADLNPLEHYGRRPTRASFVRYQRDLRGHLLTAAAGLPMTVVDATADLGSVVDEVEAALRVRAEQPV
jgi:thymidylate kinase